MHGFICLQVTITKSRAEWQMVNFQRIQYMEEPFPSRMLCMEKRVPSSKVETEKKIVFSILYMNIRERGR